MARYGTFSGMTNYVAMVGPKGAAMLAPTAMNQQKFRFTLKDGKVSAKAGMGFYSKIDLGIAKYHFGLGADKPGMVWCE